MKNIHERNTMIPQDATSGFCSGNKQERAEATRQLACAGPEGIAFVRPYLASPNWILRYRACEVIGSSACAEYASEILPLLSDEKDHVRYMAVKSLGMLGVSETYHDAIESLLHDENQVVAAMSEAILSTGTPLSPNSVFISGLNAYVNHDLKRAEILIARAVGMSPENPNYISYLGMIKRDQGDLEKAETLFSKATSLAPTSIPLRYSNAEVLFMREYYDDAEPLFKSICMDENKDGLYWKSLSHLHLGLIALKSDNIDTALIEFSDAEDIAKILDDAGLHARISAELERNGF